MTERGGLTDLPVASPFLQVQVHDACFKRVQGVVATGAQTGWSPEFLSRAKPALHFSHDSLSE